jgi:hypothetical protein
VARAGADASGRGHGIGGASARRPARRHRVPGDRVGDADDRTDRVPVAAHCRCRRGWPRRALSTKSGRGFLRHMVRGIAERSSRLRAATPRPGCARSSTRSRALAGRTAPAAGLFLVRVEYQTPDL